jgi:hypothetical protein
MRVTKRIAGDHSFFIHTTLYKYPNDITSQYSQCTVLQRYYLLTPISMWHYNYNRTPLSTRVITMPKASESKGSIKYRPVRIKLASPQPSLSAKQSRILMMSTTSTSSSRSKSTRTRVIPESTLRTRKLVSKVL